MDRLNRIDRRSLLLAAGAFAAVGPAELARAQAAGAIKVATWGGSWRDSLDKLVGESVRKAGGSVDYVVDTPQGNLAKLVAARGGNLPFDTMESGLELVQLMAADRFVADLNYDKLPNAKALPDFAKAKNYVMTLGSMDGIVYNHEKFKELGLEPPKTYSDLGNPRLAGKVAFPDITHTQHWNAVAGLAYEAGASEADLLKAIPLVNKIKPAYFYSASTELSTKMAAGEVWAAPWHAGFVVRLRRNKVPLSISYPSFGSKKGSLWPVLHHIVRGTKNEALAETFVNAYLDPETQLAHAKATGVLPISRAAIKGMVDDPENKGVLMLGDAELDNLFVVDFAKVKLAEWRNAWARDIARG
ncbi:PotD/PotF family extracellular solute-binding protein [Bosea sp. BH3]|uniref:ABC transporter substrate-binding protein n=1 Tax=Bosea sp. BH3 TaxID=2871701 RepID=UPI0021CB945F|nr:extracellular solute-binding protein [Bosea sp. BH3]MCU4178260.1 extracellular solute-binding protein [Bosea sp. BH3]